MKYLIAAHPDQQAILNFIANNEVGYYSLRDIGKKAGLKNISAQRIKHHLSQMVRYGFIDVVGGKYRVGKIMKKNI